MEQEEAEKPNARSLALRRLGVREYSAHEMRSYLKRKGVESEEAARVVEELVGERMIDDHRYAGVVARAQSNRDQGPGKIMAKLRAKGVRAGLAEARALFNEHSSRDELSLARSILERRYPNAREDLREQRRAYAALIRRGFSGDVARRALGSADPGEGEE